MKVAFFYDGLDIRSHFFGGAIYLNKLGELLRREGINVSFLVPSKNIVRNMSLVKSSRGSSLRRNSFKPLKVLTINKCILNSIDLLRSFDVIHSISWSSIPSLNLISKNSRFNTSFLFDCRTSLLNIKRSFNFYKLFVLKFFPPNYVIFSDEKSFRDYLNFFDYRRVEYIPIPVDLQIFKRYGEHELKNKFRILFASSLSHDKGLLDLLKAMKYILNHYSNVELLVAGDGPLRDYVLELSKERKWLRYLGFVDHYRMPMLLNSVDLLVHPSYYEAVSSTVLEGLACEVPVITTNVCGHIVLKEVVRLVPSSSPGRLSKEILYMLENEAVRKRYSRVGRRYVEENNSWDQAIQRVIHIYELLMKNTDK